MKKFGILTAAFSATVALSGAANALDANLPEYQIVEGVSGQMRSVGSDTLNNEMLLWTKAFKAKYRGVIFEVEGKGSATAPPALLDGSAQFGPMSRPMTAAEMDAFKSKYGYDPIFFRVGVDALAIYVNKDNPIQCLSQTQLDRIFSTTRQGSGGRNIASWGDIGLNGDWANAPIALFGRNALSGTHEFFRSQVLYGGDFKPSAREEIGSAEVVDLVAHDKFAIGYSGLGYKTDGVRVLKVAAYDGGECYDTSEETVRSGKYPIARYLGIYVNKDPKQELEPLRAEFIKFVVSKDGQTLTEKGGYYPITNGEREADLKILGLLPDGR